mgnify:CR=1 FL=1
MSNDTFGQYTEKQLKRLDKMDIKAAIYNQEVNEPIISEILIRDRRHFKILGPAILLTSFSAAFLTGFALYDNGSPAVIAPLITIGTATGVSSLGLYALSIHNRSKRNKLIKQLNN